jgi:hypothetical protein
MHKGYKCLDRSTGRIYVSRDVIFDEKVFPYATPGVTVDVSQLLPVAFPSQEPVIQNTNTRLYDTSLLLVDLPGVSFVVPVQVLMSQRTRWETPRGRYDEHNSKFSLSMKPKFNRPVGERNHL